jgi:predicted metal-dependent HD superfamily phosphohydrolase
MNYDKILKSIGYFVDTYIQERSKAVYLPYHNALHTQKVVEAAKKIATHYELNDHDNFVVLAAAWFHDLGYYSGEGKGHEQRGADMVADFLKDENVDKATVLQIKKCIMATKMPQKPNALLEQIVCDADLFHLGSDEFAERNKLMRKEQELALQQEIDKKVWRADTIKLFQSHHYHTDYCQSLLNAPKQANLDALLKKEKKAAEEQTMSNTPKIAGEDKIKPEKPVRGIETMFRVASTNHQSLSDMADSKANIMISVNAIIISVVFGLVGRRLEAGQSVLFPALILLLGCVAAIIFSVLATRPKIPNGFFSQDQINDQTANLLFFGNFYKMDYENYQKGMRTVMADSDFLYNSLIRDIYSQGKVLGNKYKLLRISYTIFMFTLIVSVLAFAIVLLFFDK